MLKRPSPDVGEGVPALPCVRYAPAPVGRTVPGAPLRWTAEHLTYMSIPALLIHPVRGGVLDAPRAAACDFAGWLLKRPSRTHP